MLPGSQRAGLCRHRTLLAASAHRHGPRPLPPSACACHPAAACRQVRLEFLRTISDWMLNLRERVDHEPRLLPYALSALNDACPQVRARLACLQPRAGRAACREVCGDDACWPMPPSAQHVRPPGAC